VWRVRSKSGASPVAADTQLFSLQDPPSSYESVKDFSGFPSETVVVEVTAVAGGEGASHTFEIDDLEYLGYNEPDPLKRVPEL
jgi:hypothetical protein